MLTPRKGKIMKKNIICLFAAMMMTFVLSSCYAKNAGLTVMDFSIPAHNIETECVANESFRNGGDHIQLFVLSDRYYVVDRTGQTLSAASAIQTGEGASLDGKIYRCSFPALNVSEEELLADEGALPDAELYLCAASNDNDFAVVGFTDYFLDPTVETPVENETAVTEEKQPETNTVDVTANSGSVEMSFTDNVQYDLEAGIVSLDYYNPEESNYNVIVSVVLNNGSGDRVIARSDSMTPGKSVGVILTDTPVKPGTYAGKMLVQFLDRKTGEEAMLNTEINCTINVY